MIATDQALEGGSIIPAAFSGSMQPHSRRAKCTKRPLSETSCEKPPPFQTHAVLGFLPRAHRDRDSDSDRGSTTKLLPWSQLQVADLHTPLDVKLV